MSSSQGEKEMTSTVVLVLDVLILTLSTSLCKDSPASMLSIGGGSTSHQRHPMYERVICTSICVLKIAFWQSVVKRLL